MSLDVAITDENGIVVKAVAIGVDEHLRLMRQAQPCSLRLLSRMHDYYQDVDYTPDEVPLLLNETKLLIANGGDPILDALLKNLMALIQLALSNSASIIAIAD